MFNMNEMKLIIKWLALNNLNNWDAVYDAIKARQNVEQEELAKINLEDNDCFIIDDNYPGAFKELYMPPLYFKASSSTLKLFNKQIANIKNLVIVDVHNHNELHFKGAKKNKPVVIKYGSQPICEIQDLLYNPQFLENFIDACRPYNVQVELKKA